jgi:periplasmic protein TonB
VQQIVCPDARARAAAYDENGNLPVHRRASIMSAPARFLALLRRALPLSIAALLVACTITPPPPDMLILTPTPVPDGNVAQYRLAVAHRIAERNPSRILHGTPQAMLRSLVVVSFTVDRVGHVIHASVYRSNGDDESESIALATLHAAAPLPPPPSRLLDGRGELEMMECWLFNDNGQFQLRTTAVAQAQTLD